MSGSEVYCPHCDEPQEVSLDWLADGVDRFDTECEKCGKPFVAQAEFDVSWCGEVRRCGVCGSEDPAVHKPHRIATPEGPMTAHWCPSDFHREATR